MPIDAHFHSSADNLTVALPRLQATASTSPPIKRCEGINFAVSHADNRDTLILDPVGGHRDQSSIWHSDFSHARRIYAVCSSGY